MKALPIISSSVSRGAPFELGFSAAQTREESRSLDEFEAPSACFWWIISRM